MKQQNYYRYFRVFKNDTKVFEISTKDFISVKSRPVNNQPKSYKPAVDEPLFSGYLKHAKAIEMAKAGAIAHINSLLAMGKDGELALFEYRFHHYQDLMVSFAEANINNLL